MPPVPAGEEAAPPSPVRMPLSTHLEELRRRLFWVVGAWILGAVIGCACVRPLYRVLIHPYLKVAPAGAEGGSALRARDPWTSLGILTRIMLYAGAATALPVALVQGGAFLSPGLRAGERSALRGVAVFGTALFGAGAAFGYAYLVPVSLRFSIALERVLGLTHEWFAADTVAFILPVVLVSGVCFELPLVMGILARAGILRQAHLKGRWRFVILGAFVAGAVLTPPDVVSQVVLSGCLLGLYGFGLWLVGRLERPVS